MTRHFQCDGCGACCLQLPLFGDIYAELDDGNGVCRHYDQETRRCTIYARRPLQCRVDDGYRAWFSDIPYERYLLGVEEGCRRLRQSLHNARLVSDTGSRKPS